MSTNEEGDGGVPAADPPASSSPPPSSPMPPPMPPLADDDDDGGGAAATTAAEAMAAMSVDDDDDAPPQSSSSSYQPERQQPPPIVVVVAPPPKRRAVLASPPPLPLDWTRLGECASELTSGAGGGDDPPGGSTVVRYPWDVIDVSEDDERLTIVGTAGQKITRMGDDLHLKLNPKLTHLILRSHLLRTMEGIGSMEHLELLELYDNQVDELRCLDLGSGPMGSTLRVLDISYNVIRDMGPLVSCPNLEELYIAQNKIKTISGIRGMARLRKIDLGANRIRAMDPVELDGLDSLEELWLGKNKIQRISGLGALTKLRRLDVQSNRLTKIEGLESQANTLEELYLSHNGIDDAGASECPGGLCLNFVVLNTIDMSRNRLTSVRPFGHLTSLIDLWISGNDIKTFDDVEDLRKLVNLDSVYLEYNPLDKEFEYRKRLAEMVPSLTQIDANKIGGLAAYGWGGVGGGGWGSAGDPVVRMKNMQDLAIQRAKMQGQEKKDEEDGPVVAVAVEGDMMEGDTREAVEDEEGPAAEGDVMDAISAGEVG